MRRRGRREGGFTLVEMMIVVAIVGILAALAIPNYYDRIRQAKAGVCQGNRQAVEKAAIMYQLDVSLPEPAPLPSIQNLIHLRYLDSEPQCPSGGVFIWAFDTYRRDRTPSMGCSIHFIPPEE